MAFASSLADRSDQLIDSREVIGLLLLRSRRFIGLHWFNDFARPIITEVLCPMIIDMYSLVYTERTVLRKEVDAVKNNSIMSKNDGLVFDERHDVSVPIYHVKILRRPKADQRDNNAPRGLLGKAKIGWLATTANQPIA